MCLNAVAFTCPSIVEQFIGLPGADALGKTWRRSTAGKRVNFRTGRAEHSLPVCRSGTTPSPFVPLPNPQQGRPVAIVFFAHLADRSFQCSAKADAGEFQILMDFAFEKGSLVIFRLSPPAANGLELEFAPALRIRRAPMRSGGLRIEQQANSSDQSQYNKREESCKLANPTDCLLAAPAAQVSSPSDARENLETGSVAGIGRYLHDDVASLLKLIPKHRQQSGQQSTNPPGYDPDLEFEFDTADVAWAIENGLSALVDDYLREVGKLMTLLGDMLDRWLISAAARSGNAWAAAGASKMTAFSAGPGPIE